MKLGKVSNLISASLIDAALVDIENQVTDQLIPFGVKPVDKIIALNNQALFDSDQTVISVVRDGSEKLIKGQLLDWKFNYQFSIAGDHQYMYDLVLIKVNDGSGNTIEQGDSGSMIYYMSRQNTNNKLACAILIAKCSIDGHHYALGINLDYLTKVLQLGLL